MHESLRPHLSFKIFSIVGALLLELFVEAAVRIFCLLRCLLCLSTGRAQISSSCLERRLELRDRRFRNGSVFLMFSADHV